MSTYEYDSHGRVSARTTVAGEKLTYGYDTYGRLNRTTTSAGTTEYTYDAYDRLTSVATADGTTAYTYDRNGNKASQSNPNGTTVSYEYDSCNRLTEETVRTREGKVLASYGYTYNKNGQKITATEEAGGSRTESEYSYDALNRLIKETTKITSREGEERTERTAYTYDAVGNRIKKLQDGAIYQYEYNQLNQLTKEKTPDGETIYQYDADGNLTFRGSGNRGETYTYSVDGKLLSYKDNTGATVTEEAYTYDGEGNRLSKEETAGNVSRNGNGMILSSEKEKKIINGAIYRLFLIDSLHFFIKLLDNNEHGKAYDVIDILHAVPNVIIINERKSKRLFYKTYIKKFSRKWKEHFFDKMKVLFK